MTRTLNLNATVAFPAGEIALRIDGAQLDAQALGSIQETLGLMLELAVNVDEPAAETPAPELTPEAAAEPAPAKPKRRTAPKTATVRGGSTIALLRRIEDDEGTFEGSLFELGQATPDAGSSEGARKQAAALLTKTDLVTTVRNDRGHVLSITITDKGRALLVDGTGTNTEPPRPTPAPEPVGRRPLPKAVDDPDDGTDLDWAAEALAP